MLEITPESLLHFLRRQDAIELEEQREAEALPLTDRIARGDALTGLRPLGPAGEEGFTFACHDEASRFRSGDWINLSSGEQHVAATIIEISADRLSVDHQGPFAPDVEWTAELRRGLFSGVAVKALEVLREQKLGPGRMFLQVLNGSVQLEDGRPLSAPPAALAEALEAVTTRSLNADQRAAFVAAVAQPTAFGLQGPPGTGKTQVAALVAEALAREGRRVLVVAQSHEAVNNLLGEVKQLFPQRTVVKTGTASRSTVPEGVTFAPQPALEGLLRLRGERIIVGMTVHEALLHASRRKLLFEAVIVDEAGQVPLAYGAPLGLLAGAVLMFGDPAQLNAIFPEGLEGDPLACSLLHRFGDAIGVDGQRLAFLSETHRLNATLAAAVGDTYYSGRGFRAAEANADKSFPLPAAIEDSWVREVLAPDHPLVWVRTREVGRYRSSPEEATLIARVVAQLTVAGFDPSRIGVIAPFRVQVREIRSAVQARLSEGRPPLIDTVERLQGQSVDVALVSLASSDPDRVAAMGDFFFSDNRWNVALSRARTKVVVFGSPLVLDATPASLAAATGVMRLRQLLRSAHAVDSPT